MENPGMVCRVLSDKLKHAQCLMNHYISPGLCLWCKTTCLNVPLFVIGQKPSRFKLRMVQKLPSWINGQWWSVQTSAELAQQVLATPPKKKKKAREIEREEEGENESWSSLHFPSTITRASRTHPFSPSWLWLSFGKGWDEGTALRLGWLEPGPASRYPSRGETNEKKLRD